MNFQEIEVLGISKRQNHKEDGANFCGLLRKAELYRWTIFKSSNKKQSDLTFYGSILIKLKKP